LAAFSECPDLGRFLPKILLEADRLECGPLPTVYAFVPDVLLRLDKLEPFEEGIVVHLLRNDDHSGIITNADAAVIVGPVELNNLRI
jgi:hypothetical protein